MKKSNEIMLEKINSVQQQVQKISNLATKSNKYSPLLANEIHFINMRLCWLKDQIEKEPKKYTFFKQDFKPTITDNDSI